eukprot:scaffold14092_cov122-Isochrysis_galbana.AAC.3
MSQWVDAAIAPTAAQPEHARFGVRRRSRCPWSTSHPCRWLGVGEIFHPGSRPVEGRLFVGGASPEASSLCGGAETCCQN